MKDTLNRFSRYFRPLLKKLMSNRGEIQVAEGTATGAGSETESEGAGAGQAEPWFNVLPEQARQDANITKYKTADDFYTGHKNLVELVGRKGVIVPKDDSVPEETEKFYNSIGRPEKAEGYKFSQIEKLHASIDTKPETQAKLAGMYHKLGLTQKQADATNKLLYASFSETAFAQEKANLESMQKSEAQLRSEMGADYDKNMIAAKRFAKRFGGDELINALGEKGNDPRVLKAFANAAKAFSEDSVARGGFSNLMMNKDQAKVEIDKVKNDPKHPWHNDGPGHEDAVQKMNELYKIAYGVEV